jgi:hypothetical protein
MKNERRSKKAARTATKRGFMTGAAGRENVDTELKKAAARKEQRDRDRNKPFRFRMKEGEEGREIVILDDAPDFFMYEHTLQDPTTGWWNLHLSCCQIFDTCAVCESPAEGTNASYNMVLTALDLQEYTTRNKDVVPFSRKLYVVKSRQHKKFIRLYEKKGTLRGARFILARDGNKDPVIGSEIEFDGFMEEAELAEYVREYTDREGKKHVEDCSQPFIYEDVFDEPDPELLRDNVPGGAPPPPPGSREANNEEPMQKSSKSRRDEKDDDDYAEDDGSDDVPWEEDDEADEKVDSDDDYEEESEEASNEDEAEEDEAEEEEAEEEEPEEEKPVRKRRTPSASKSRKERPAPRKTRRATRH